MLLLVLCTRSTTQIFLVWIGSGVVLLGLYPVARSLDLLAAVGLTGTPALAALYLLCFFDIAIGLMVLCMRRKWLWGVQILVVLGYTLLITAALPELWLHPFGPLLKNLPILRSSGRRDTRLLAYRLGLEARPSRVPQ
jgi:hypothetical protein